MKSIAGLLKALDNLETEAKGHSLDDLGKPGAGKPVAAKIAITTATPLGDKDEPGDDDLGGTPTAMNAFPDLGEMSPDDGSEPAESGQEPGADSAAQDAQIVDLLQSQFPEIYEQIAKMLTASS